jgi:aerobic C4-dicarboxylate transport protein
MPRPPLYRNLYAQVIAAIALGWIVGVIWPEKGAAMRPLGDGFIKLIRMLIAPIIFTTITVGIANMGEMKDVGRIGLRAFIYFEVVSTLALVIGLVVVNVLQPGVGLHVTATPADVQAVAGYGAQAAQTHDTVAFLLNIIPTTMVDAFARGDILQGAPRRHADGPRAPRARPARRGAGAGPRSAVAGAVRHRRR